MDILKIFFFRDSDHKIRNFFRHKSICNAMQLQGLYSQLFNIGEHVSSEFISSRILIDLHTDTTQQLCKFSISRLRYSN